MDTRTFLDGITRMLSLYAPQVTNACQNLLSSHDVERFRTVADGNARRLRLASLFQMTMPGAPGIYYGDEIGRLLARSSRPATRPGQIAHASQQAVQRDLVSDGPTEQRGAYGFNPRWLRRVQHCQGRLADVRVNRLV